MFLLYMSAGLLIRWSTYRNCKFIYRNRQWCCIQNICFRFVTLTILLRGYIIYINGSDIAMTRHCEIRYIDYALWNRDNQHIFIYKLLNFIYHFIFVLNKSSRKRYICSCPYITKRVIPLNKVTFVTTLV